MSAFFSWLRSRFWIRSVDANSAQSSKDNLEAALERARDHARAGRLHEASQALWSIKPKHHTAETIAEHAEVMLDLGDCFGAASRAARALELDPQNARAMSVRRRVLELDDAERRRS